MGLRGMMSKIPVAATHHAIIWLRQGISPRRLALTLALGFAVGCIPVIGIPTVLCAGLALALRLNLPAIQTANYIAMPLQLILIVPFVRLGRWIIPPHGNPAATGLAPHGLTFDPHTLLHLPALNLASLIADLAGKAVLAWLLVAIPAVVLMTFGLTHMLRRIPALNTAEAAD
jgi:uncharacterized protein (DUF2062 family)